MNKKKLNDQFGISDKEIDSLMKEAEEEKDSLGKLSQEELDAIQQRKELVSNIKSSLKDMKTVENNQWVEAIMKTAIENAVIGQQLAIADLEDDFQSKKVSSISELTNAITTGASEIVKLEHQSQHLELAKEKNELRRLQISGGKIIDSDNNKGENLISGKGKDLLKLIKNSEIKDVDVEDSKENE
jgi:hypothetical protein